MAPQIC